MKCKCGKETNKISIAYVKGIKLEFCPNCRNSFSRILGDSEDYKMTVNYGEGSKYTIGAAHLKDIKSRRYDWVTGEVYRDKGRKYI